MQERKIEVVKSKINLILFQLDLRHMNQLPTNNSIGVAMDLRDFYISTEWDVMEVPAQRNEKYYPCCEVLYNCEIIIE